MLMPHMTREECNDAFQRALFRVRLLLALEGQRGRPLELNVSSKRRVTNPIGSAMDFIHNDDVGTFAASAHEASLLTLDLEEESAERTSESARRGVLPDPPHKHEAEEKKKQTETDMNETMGSITFEPLRLPPLRWQPPSPLMQQQACSDAAAALTKQRVRHTHKKHTSTGNTDNTVGSAKVESPPHALSASTSLTQTSERSERSGSRDTYAPSEGSYDDVYIHELARAEHTLSSPVASPFTQRSSPAIAIGTTSNNGVVVVAGRNGSGGIGKATRSRATFTRTNLSSSWRAEMHETGASSGSLQDTFPTVRRAMAEFDRIGTGEAEPYTSYLFSPLTSIVDLNKCSTGGTMKKPPTDGCTRVCFSPDGSCYIIGTQQGYVWFVQVDGRGAGPGNTSLSPLQLQGHSAAVMDMCFNDDATFFASAGADACVMLWNQRTRLKARRMNTDGGIPTIVRFMPRNNNYLLVSLPQNHLLRLYNTSTGLPVTLKGAVMRLEVSALAVEPSADPFLFAGDVNGGITMWQYRASGGRWALPSVMETEDNLGQSLRPMRVLPSESQPRFEKIAATSVGKGVGVVTLVASAMNHQQLHSLLRAQRSAWQQEQQQKQQQQQQRQKPQGQELQNNTTTSVSQHASQNSQLGYDTKPQVFNQPNPSSALGRARRGDVQRLSAKSANAISARTACAVMLLASFPCDRLVLLCVRSSTTKPNAAPNASRGYEIVPMLTVSGLCRLRQPTAGTAFCADNARCPTIACTCEEGLVRLIACTGETAPWRVLATLAVPCGGIPCGLAWSPDMRCLVAVTAEGTLYQWQRIHLQHHTHTTRGGGGNHAEVDDESTGGKRGAQEEADEWRVYFQRERERQMRRYRAEKDKATNSNSLTGSDGWWTSCDDDSLVGSAKRSSS